jgi:hypothetical protein
LVDGPFMKKLAADKDSDTAVCTQRMIGSVIGDLVENLYHHKFTKAPYNQVTQDMVQKILNDTVRFPSLNLAFSLTLPIRVICVNAH